jgi:hypothetical protein
MSSCPSRSRFTEKQPVSRINGCALALRFTHTITVGGESESEQNAVAVKPVRLPGAPVAMMTGAPAWCRMSLR